MSCEHCRLFPGDCLMCGSAAGQRVAREAYAAGFEAAQKSMARLFWQGICERRAIEFDREAALSKKAAERHKCDREHHKRVQRVNEQRAAQLRGWASK